MLIQPFVKGEVQYVVSATLLAPSGITKIKHVFKQPFTHCASLNSNTTDTALMGACDGMSKQVNVGYLQ